MTSRPCVNDYTSLVLLICYEREIFLKKKKNLKKAEGRAYSQLLQENKRWAHLFLKRANLISLVCVLHEHCLPRGTPELANPGLLLSGSVAQILLSLISSCANLAQPPSLKALVFPSIILVLGGWNDSDILHAKNVLQSKTQCRTLTKTTQRCPPSSEFRGVQKNSSNWPGS